MYSVNESICFNFQLLSPNNISDNKRLSIFFTVNNLKGERICSFESDIIKSTNVQLKMDAFFLVRGFYNITAFIHIPGQLRTDEVEEVCEFEIIDEKSDLSIHGNYNYGSVFGNGNWIY